MYKKALSNQERSQNHKNISSTQRIGDKFLLENFSHEKVTKRVRFRMSIYDSHDHFPELIYMTNKTQDCIIEGNRESNLDSGMGI